MGEGVANLHGRALLRRVGRDQHLEQLASFTSPRPLSIKQLKGAIVVHEVECLCAVCGR
ncbi:hypothetical protein D3C81_795220 [compost metagenome]